MLNRLRSFIHLEEILKYKIAQNAHNIKEKYIEYSKYCTFYTI